MPVKPKRTRRTAKPAADGEEAAKPKRRTDAHDARQAHRCRRRLGADFR
ncbi:MAG: hypothetical protein ACLU7D_06530 [Collinsella sp.]